MPSHEAKLAMRNYVAAAPVGRNSDARAAVARHQADATARQAEIWAKVRETQEQLSRSVGAPVAASASPSSLQLSLESAKLKEAQAAYIDALQGAGESSDNIVGYVFAINGKINGGDVYASSTLFRKMWRKLLTANVTEAIGEKREAAARNLRIIDDLRWRLASRFTSATRKVRGSAVPTRTPMVCFRREPTCRCTRKPI